MQTVWSELIEVKNPDYSDICNQVLWNNRYITVNKKLIQWHSWLKHGILKVADILNDKGEFLTHEEINRKYTVNCNFLNAMQIRQSIPYTWRLPIKENKELAIRYIVGINTDGIVQ